MFLCVLADSASQVLAAAEHSAERATLTLRMFGPFSAIVES